MARDDLNAVYISVPVFAHGDMELDVIDRGLPFFVEKPVALDMKTAYRVQEAVRRSGVGVCVGYQRRYMPMTDKARAWLKGKTVGLVSGRYWCGTGRRDHWVTDASLSGGQLVEQATHTIDLARYLLGEIEEVFSYQAKRILEENRSNDAYVVSARFESGVIGSFSATWAWHPDMWSEANRLVIFADAYKLDMGMKTVTVEPADPEFEFPSDPGPSIDEHFIAAVRTGDFSQIRSTYDEAVKTLAVTLAANRSAELGVPVRPSDL